MTYFTSDYLEFFKELAANNHKDWFDANRKRYINSVKEPFANFVKALIAGASKINTEINISHKEAIFRVNRDVRFSKDKTPYKLRMSAIISKYGRKDKSYPGLYVELGPEKLGIYGGLFMPSTKELMQIRKAIINQFDTFNNLVSNKDFKKLFIDVKGNKNKRIDKAFVEKAQQQELLFNKQWYYTASLSADVITSDKLLPEIIAHFRVMQGMNNFFKDALNQ
jgi:uncharacterized protein (TIGR02453 family)